LELADTQFSLVPEVYDRVIVLWEIFLPNLFFGVISYAQNVFSLQAILSSVLYRKPVVLC